ncbi:Putative defensin-like protein 20-28 [Colletotrichum destructivum]|uniref:Defensin-like protein 20-28 n=1 Tax=Colletotrichum destructivum TaxID=34406 RepID=A0AAX4IQY5_9PEZI|nr:Putative defensin-like protein 20-28 [Colletotrichum destructivum]
MKLSALLPVFLLNGIASASIAQFLCNNRPPISQWGPANCSEEDHWQCYTRCQTKCPVAGQPSVASIGYVRPDEKCDCYCWV